MTRSTLHVLMFGWEYPPSYNGGLGIVCHDLAQALAHDVRVTFVLPHAMETEGDHASFLFADDYDDGGYVSVALNSILSGYLRDSTYAEMLATLDPHHPYGKTLIDEVLRYAYQSEKLVPRYDFDVIHAHDWLTFPAALAAKKVSGKPLVVHVHNTIFDRGLGHANPLERSIEEQGLREADHIIAISEWTRDILTQKYHVDPNKISVIHNQINHTFRREPNNDIDDVLDKFHDQGTKIVLSLGRTTIQKGLSHLIEALPQVQNQYDNFIVIIAGDGDTREELMKRAASLGVADKVFFPGFVRGKQRHRLYEMADLFVMPSVSEPFGIVALEAALYNTPLILSKQSGAREVMPGAIVVDFWDVDKLATSMVHVMKDPFLAQEIIQKNHEALSKMSWLKASRFVQKVYRGLIGVMRTLGKRKYKELPPPQ